MQSILAAILERSAAHQRYIVAIAGPPGSGKSTLALDLVQRLPNSAILAMDGFHYDNAVLDQMGLRARKGSPETFDYDGFAITLKRVRGCQPDIAIPVFDRDIDLARAGAAIISQTTKVVIVEGNYLLLDEPPWTGLAEYFDLTVFLDIPRAELYSRLKQRWLDLGRTPVQAEAWVTGNDMPNVERVLTSRRKEDVCVSIDDAH
jgi:pantothenate kinase